VLLLAVATPLQVRRHRCTLAVTTTTSRDATCRMLVVKKRPKQGQPTCPSTSITLQHLTWAHRSSFVTKYCWLLLGRQQGGG
jgi:hypothetical protein